MIFLLPFLIIFCHSGESRNPILRPLQNYSIRHSGLDPESMKYLIILDSGFRRNDNIAGFMQLCKGLFLIPAFAGMTVGYGLPPAQE